MTPPPASLLDKAVAVGLWGIGISWMVTVMPAVTLLTRFVPADRVDGATRFLTKGQVLLTLCRWRADVHPDIDPQRTYLFMQNHVNVLDHCTMYTSTPHFKQGMELRSHFKIPFYGWFMESRGTIPVDPKDPQGPAHLLRDMKAELERGRSLLAFPEGTRSRDGRVGRFKHGLFHLARELELPIVPVTVTGMWEVLPTGSWVMRPFQQVTVHCDAPVETRGLAREDIPALAAKVQQTISDRVDAYYARLEGS